MFKKLLLFIAFIAFVAFVAQGYAQKSPKTSAKDAPKSDKPVYNLIYKIPVNRDFKYIFDEEVNGKRINKNGGSADYKKAARYYFSMNAAGVDNDGNLTLRYSVDSLQYSLKDGLTNVNYNSQDETADPPMDIKDFEQFSIPLGTNVWFIYSSYGDLVNLGNETFLRKVADFRHPERGIRDSVRRTMWEKCLGISNLAHILDLKKGVIPNDRIFADSSYKTFINFYCEGFRFADTVEYKLTGITSKSYTLTVNVKNAKLVKEPVYATGTELLLFPESGLVSGKIELEMNVRGIMELIKSDLNYSVNYKIAGENVKHEANVKQSWKLDKMLQFAPPPKN